jgi:hypothetical protein
MDLSAGELTAIVGIISVIIGTVGGRYFDSLIKKNEIRKDEVLALTEDIDDADNLLDEWRLKYFDLREKNLDLEAKIDRLEILLHNSSINFDEDSKGKLQ